MNRTRISIVLCTYNGEAHLSEQLESLARQTHLPIELWIGDDGSSDGTVAVIKDFAKTAPFPVHLHVNESNLGYGDNFLSTAARCEGEWIAFCDQDDVWMPEKLARCSAAIEALDDDDLLMVVHAAQLVEEDLTPTGRQLPDIRKPVLWERYGQFAYWVAQGFSQVVRARLLREIDWHERPPSYFPLPPSLAHDRWTCLLANVLGKVHFIPEVCALYRRHRASLTGSHLKPNAAEVVRTLRATNAEQYRFISHAAAMTAECLRRRARSHNAWAAHLDEAARQFDRFSDLQGHRANIYEEEKILDRLSNWFALFRRGGYLGEPFCAIGLKSCAKDLTACFAPRLFSGSITIKSEN